MALSIWHISWTVFDLERSIAFYRDLMGFELLRRRVRTGTFIETVVGFPGAELHIAALRISQAPEPPSQHHLELIQYVSPKGSKLELNTNNVGAAHLALEVKSIHDDYRRLSAAGVHFVSPPVEVPDSGGYACYMRDPDGFTIELVEPPSASR
jgi:catechol 2,3-dioxygenase-like lactoylglutathione lyase family enzyme